MPQNTKSTVEVMPRSGSGGLGTEQVTPVLREWDLPCPWCLHPASEHDTRCPGCGRRFG